MDERQWTMNLSDVDLEPMNFPRRILEIWGSQEWDAIGTLTFGHQTLISSSLIHCGYFHQILKEIPQGFLEISRSQEWDGQTENLKI